jgi:hypothetical protein
MYQMPGASLGTGPPVTTRAVCQPTVRSLISELLTRRCPVLNESLGQLLSLLDESDDACFDPMVRQGMMEEIAELIADRQRQCSEDSLTLLPFVTDVEAAATTGERLLPSAPASIRRLIASRILDNSSLTSAIHRLRLLTSALCRAAEVTPFDRQIARIERESVAIVHMQHEVLFPRLLSLVARSSHRPATAH